MKRWVLAAIVIVLSLGMIGGCPPASDMSYIDNGIVKIGVDMNKGGSITYLAEFNNQDVNLINSSDLGREIQQSYYSGPQPYGVPNPGWPNWPWNPIGAGDCEGNPSEVVDHVNDGSTLYVKSIPMQWALDNVPCECVFEKWIELNGNAVEVHFKLINNRSDRNYYGARHQELPAVYTTDRFHRLFTYNGNRPYTNAPVEEIANSGPPWAYFTGTEKWAALVQDNEWGLGVYNPNAQEFAGGFHGTPGNGDPEGSSTGYLTPLRSEAINWNTVYEYDAYFILGYVDDIRTWVYQNRP
jgi:hypothetical protein